MRLTPLDIKKQEFKRSIRGYDPIEVDAFLEMIADEFEATIREKNQLADEVLKLRTQLQDYQQVEKALQETLVNAQENMTVSRQTSQREADLIMREAEIKAEKILETARLKLERLKNDIMIIKAQKESFARRLRHLLESQIELIHVLEIDDSGYGDDQSASFPKGNEAKKGFTKNTREEPGINRKKVEIPLAKKSSSPLIREASNRLARTRVREEEKAKISDKTEKKKEKDSSSMPKISDQFIT